MHYIVMHSTKLEMVQPALILTITSSDTTALNKTVAVALYLSYVN